MRSAQGGMVAEAEHVSSGLDPAGPPDVGAALELSVVMPCRNEAETVATCVEKATETIRSLGIAGEVIVVDNASVDGSGAIAEGLGARVVLVEEPGYGAALMGGFAAARGRFIIFGDADASYDFGNLEPFFDKLREGFDLVVGNRFQGGITAGAMPRLHRYLGTPVLTRLERLLFHSPVGDVNCGLRGLRTAVVERLDLQSTGMEFASEMLVKASLLGMRIAEVPTTLSVSGRTRQPHLRSWRDGWRHLRFLLLYSPRWLFLYPGLLLMAIGLAATAWLLPGPRHLGRVTFDIQTLLLAAVLILVGFQSVVFSAFTKFYAIAQGLLPHDPRLARLLRYVNLEVGLLVGSLLLATGIAGSVYAFARWSTVSFGALNARWSLRIVIPSLTCLALGSQILLSSFFLSVLGLRPRRAAVLDPDGEDPADGDPIPSE